uniref:Reverse transcriptase Ty1/copia-type domain-containing protein n=1 Tax=Tanacetum cinerariifolium TaxID=118510 RepID=A0A6L2P675_TANCI|nr:hypothetical protein [Tanacetum cinerariifolium]
MLSYSGLSEGFLGEAMLTDCYILNRTLNKNSKQTPYEIWTKKVPNLTYLRIWGCRAVVRLTEPKMKNLGKIAEDEVEGTDDVPGPSVPRKNTRTRKAKFFGSDFQLYLVEETRDKTLSQREYCFIIKEDPRTLSEEGIDFFDTYAPVARISTIRLLLALTAIHDLVIHQMDVKIAFLNGDLDKKIDMKQSKGFVMPGHKSKCVYRKIDASGKGVIICLYVDDMLIFGTDQDQVNKTKEFLSSKFDMKDLREAEVILVSQLEYSRAIGCLMYAMIYTRPDIAFDVGKLSRTIEILQSESVYMTLRFL